MRVGSLSMNDLMEHTLQFVLFRLWGRDKFGKVICKSNPQTPLLLSPLGLNGSQGCNCYLCNVGFCVFQSVGVEVSNAVYLQVLKGVLSQCLPGISGPESG